jgi:hypothetical protein
MAAMRQPTRVGEHRRPVTPHQGDTAEFMGFGPLIEPLANRVGVHLNMVSAKSESVTPFPAAPSRRDSGGSPRGVQALVHHLQADEAVPPVIERHSGENSGVSQLPVSRCPER